MGGITHFGNVKFRQKAREEQAEVGTREGRHRTGAVRGGGGQQWGQGRLRTLQASCACQRPSVKLRMLL